MFKRHLNLAGNTQRLAETLLSVVWENYKEEPPSFHLVLFYPSCKNTQRKSQSSISLDVD
jgi:type VI protein secretion system component VasA